MLVNIKDGYQVLIQLNQSDECIYRYWLNCSLNPQLRILALRTCAIPTSSTDERLFSIINYVAGPNHCSMTKDNGNGSFSLCKLQKERFGRYHLCFNFFKE